MPLLAKCSTADRGYAPKINPAGVIAVDLADQIQQNAPSAACCKEVVDYQPPLLVVSIAYRIGTADDIKEQKKQAMGNDESGTERGITQSTSHHAFFSQNKI